MKKALESVGAVEREREREREREVLLGKAFLFASLSHKDNVKVKEIKYIETG